MQEVKQRSSKGAFILTDLRPPTGSDLEKHPHLEPGITNDELERRNDEQVKGTERARLELVKQVPPPEIWKMIFTRSADVQWAVLDGQALLLNLENGRYYSLNRVGTVIWELFTGNHPLAGILAVISQRFDVAEEAAREDLIALVRRLREEKLVTEL
jgi:hypothetical protein